MKLSEQTFRRQVEGLVESMIEIALGHVGSDPRVEVLYIYGGLTEWVLFNAFYRTAEGVFAVPEIDEVLGKDDGDRSSQALGTHQMKSLMHLFVDNDRDTPYELRLVYDCRSDSLDYAFNYDPPATWSIITAETEWREAVAEGEEPLPPLDPSLARSSGTDRRSTQPGKIQ